MKNLPLPLKIVLDYDTYWISSQRRWRLPHNIEKSAKKVSIWVDKEQIPDNEIILEKGIVKFSDPNREVTENNKVIAEVTLKKHFSISRFQQNLILAMVGIIPATLIYLYTSFPISSSKQQESNEALTGTQLAALPCYPVVIDNNGTPVLDTCKFTEACNQLLKNSNQRAAYDLVYLGQSNNISQQLSTTGKKIYRQLIDKYKITEFDDIDKYKKELFGMFVQIVNGIGMTFQNTNIEFVLHDTRNPLASVITIQNAISGRKEGSPTTNFGVGLIKDYAQLGIEGSSYLCYSLSLKTGEVIKSSTIPLFSKKYGLVGFVCINMKIKKLKNGDKDYTRKFIDDMIAIKYNKKIEEIVDNTK